ncbi:hypothetical protein [Hyalangium minutum]|uniref:Putative lipoprotein n=1 Tax=Hyalangium minutum TaxID=394096 RepID=A0A085WN48_9BACT|nr:hypothetical protein [Hyalangium minutum]KFE69111.1 putative lipoprotein [Hyalangium minutum]
MIRLSLPSLIVTASLLAAACATPATGRPPQPPASPTVQAEMGQREVLQAGEEYARLQGYAVAGKQEVVELRPNYWRLRFGLAERHSGKLLSLEFDGASRSVVREEIIPETGTQQSP